MSVDRSISTRKKKAALIDGAAQVTPILNPGSLEVPQAVATENRLLAIVLQCPARQADFVAVMETDLFNDERNKLIASALPTLPPGKIDEATVFAALPEHEFRIAAGNHLGMLGLLPAKVDDFEQLLAGLQNLRAKRSANDETFRRLAKLSSVAYDQCRLEEAKRLGIRPATLDDEVEARQPKALGGGDALQGGKVNLPDPNPWPESVDGAVVLAEVADTICRYIHLPPGAADALALWVGHAHAGGCFTHSPRLNIRSPEKGSGKSTLRDVIAQLVPRPLPAENLSVAVLFRLVEAHTPTVLADEYDTWIRDAEELRGLLNAGHARGAMAYRCEGDAHEVRGFRVFCPVVLAGIGQLPGTLHDRSIIVELERAKPGEVRARFDSRRTERERELCRKLARWAADNIAEIEARDPVLPGGAFNRLADNWRPLLAIAEAAGGDWPSRAAKAFTELTGRDSDDHGIATMLLEDIRWVFAEARADKLFSNRLVEALNLMTDRPWPEAHRGRPISETWLARKLKSFVKSHNVRIGEQQAKGYDLSDFAEAFDRYLPPMGGDSIRPSVPTPANIEDSSLSNPSQPETVGRLENAVSPNKDGIWDGGTLRGTGGRREGAEYV